ncbi:MAG TPA: hypothetical protein VNN10_00970 [Dehalococcoidia bacterium]|nr:hypothetical protein [Dehalococcoidia bacterium]
MAEVIISEHARAQFEYRGTNEEEVIAAIGGSAWFSAGRGRLDCRKDFEFEGEWNGRPCSRKQVRPVFIEDTGGVLVLTVYTYFS